MSAAPGAAVAVNVHAASGLLAAVVASRLTPDARAWFDAARALAEPARIAEAFTLAARRLGKAGLAPTADEQRSLAAGGVTWPLGALGVDEAGRAALLLAAAERLAARGLRDLVERCYGSGDNRERQAVLKALPLLPAPETFVDVAVDACRTAIVPVFEAIACENPYPARYFPEPNFNQMALKAVFVGVALARILGLEGRRTPELARMARDFASERRAAGRTIPADLGLLIAEGA